MTVENTIDDRLKDVINTVLSGVESCKFYEDASRALSELDFDGNPDEEHFSNLWMDTLKKIQMLHKPYYDDFEKTHSLRSNL